MPLHLHKVQGPQHCHNMWNGPFSHGMPEFDLMLPQGMTQRHGLRCCYTMTCNPAAWYVHPLHAASSSCLLRLMWSDCIQQSMLICHQMMQSMYVTTDWQGSVSRRPNIVGMHGSMDCASDVEGRDLQQGMLAEKGRRKAWVRPRFASCARCACCSLMSCRKQCMRVACMSAWGCCCHLALSISSAAPFNWIVYLQQQYHLLFD